MGKYDSDIIKYNNQSNTMKDFCEVYQIHYVNFRKAYSRSTIENTNIIKNNVFVTKSQSHKVTKKHNLRSRTKIDLIKFETFAKENSYYFDQHYNKQAAIIKHVLSMVNLYLNLK